MPLAGWRRWRPVQWLSGSTRHQAEVLPVGEGARLTIHDIFTHYPELLSQVAAFAAEERSHGGEAAGVGGGIAGLSGLHRQMRCWSPGFRRFIAEDPAVADPRFQRTVASCRALVRSGRGRGLRLLVCASWLLLIGVLCPVLSTVWATQDASLKKDSHPDFSGRRWVLFLVAAASLLIAAGLPTAPQAEPALQSAVELMSLHGAAREEGGGATRGARAGRGEDAAAAEGLEAARSSIGASRAFLLSVKRGLVACSSLGILITLHPLAGSCLACVGVLAGLLPHAKFAGFDVRLSVMRMLQPSRHTALSIDGSAFLAEQHQQDEAARLRQLPAGCRLMAVRALTSSCLLVCAFRSLAVWVSSLHGCGQAEKDAHDVVCLPSLVAMMCPGFVALGAVIRIAMAWPGCCEQAEGGSGEVEMPRGGCYAAAWVYFSVPLVVLNALGIFFVLKLLADVGHSPLSEVFSLWRVPAWEEVLVLLAISALWLALLLFGAVVPACLRIISSDGAPSFFGFFAASYLLFEVVIAMGILSHGGDNFLPEMMMITTSISTAILALGCVIYILYMAATFAGSSPREGVTAGYGFLWG